MTDLITTTTTATARMHATGAGPAPRGSAAKDYAICAVIFAGAAIAWFGWGQAGQRLGVLLGLGSVLAVLVTVAAAIGIRRTPGVPTMNVDPQARRSYLFWVATEVVLIVAGAILLNRSGHPDLVSAWTLAVVGAHFVPLARAFRLPILRTTAAWCVLAALAAVAAGVSGFLPTPTVAGLAGGLVLVSAALASMRATRR